MFARRCFSGRLQSLHGRKSSSDSSSDEKSFRVTLLQIVPPSLSSELGASLYQKEFREKNLFPTHLIHPFCFLRRFSVGSVRLSYHIFPRASFVSCISSLPFVYRFGGLPSFISSSSNLISSWSVSVRLLYRPGMSFIAIFPSWHVSISSHCIPSGSSFVYRDA